MVEVDVAGLGDDRAKFSEVMPLFLAPSKISHSDTQLLFTTENNSHSKI